MKDKCTSPLRKAKSSPGLSRLKAPPLCWALALWLLAACAPKATPPPPPPAYPSRVVTQEGLAFMVHRFRIPGTRQEIVIRDGEAKQWMALNLIQAVRFTGLIQEGYRQAEIILISGEKMRGEVFVNLVVEGTTDLGYWNTSLSKVERLDLGRD